MLIGGLLTPTAAFASNSVSWTGNGNNTLWTNPDNWGGNVPQDGDSVSIGPTPSNPTPHVTGMPGGTRLQDLTLSNSSLDGGQVIVKGNLIWSVADLDTSVLNADVTVQGSATLSGDGLKDTDGAMTFEDNTDVSGGMVRVDDPGRAITNSGVFTLEPGTEIEGSVCCVSLRQFVNAGTLRVPSGPTGGGTATLAAMDLRDNGTISVAKDSTLMVTVGPAELRKDVRVTGFGTVDFDGGAIVTLGAATSIAAGATLQLDGNARFTGTGSFIGGGRFAWTGGDIEANLDVAKTVLVAVSGKNIKALTSVTSKPVLLALHGNTTVKGPGPVNVGIANITNTGTFTEFTGALVQGGTCCVSPARFLNSGTLAVPSSKKGVAGIALMDLQDHGAITIGTGSTLHVTVGPVELTASRSISRGGTLEFDASAAVTLAKNVAIGGGTTVQLTGEATFNGTGNFTGTGHLLWTGGSIQGNLDVAKTISTAISGSLNKEFGSLTAKPVALTLRGPTAVTGTGPVFLGSAATWTNLGTMTLHSGTLLEGLTCCVAPDHFANGGTLTVSASPKNTGITNVAFANTGQVKLVSGTFSVSGTGYHQAKTGVLAVTPTGTKAGTNYGQLIVHGNAALAGTISVTPAGSYKPKAGQGLAVLTYSSRTGKFTKTTGKAKFKVVYKASGASIRFS